MSRTGRKLRYILASAIVPLAASRTILAQTSGSWIVDADGSWSIGSNWSSNPLTPGSGGIATFGTFSSLSGQRIVTSDPANITVGGLTFDSEARYLIVPPTGNTTNTITLNGSANLNVISSTPGSPSV